MSEWAKMVEEIKAKVSEYEAHPVCESVCVGRTRYWCWLDDAAFQDVFLVVHPAPEIWWCASGEGLGYSEQRIDTLCGTRTDRVQDALDRAHDEFKHAVRQWEREEWQKAMDDWDWKHPQSPHRVTEIRVPPGGTAAFLEALAGRL